MDKKYTLTELHHHNSEAMSALRALGIYRLLINIAIHFNSILFRIILGVTGGVQPKAAALVSTLEFIFNFIFEVPTGVFADRYGRVPLATTGFFCIALSLICSLMAVISKEHETFSIVFLVFNGIFIGIGKPMFSGAVEAFYQDSIFRSVKSEPAGNTLLHRSFALANGFGRYLPTFIVIGVFSWLYFSVPHGIAHWGFLFGAALYFILAIKVIRDGKKFGDPAKTQSNTHFYTLIKAFLHSKKALFAVFLNIVSQAYVWAVLGYLIIAIGRRYAESGFHSSLFLMASFMFGYLALGWILKSFLLPWAVVHLEPKIYLVSLFLSLGLSAAFGLLVFDFLSAVGVSILLFLFGAIFQICQTGVRDYGLNQILAAFGKEDYATAVSISNLASYAYIALYNFFLFWLLPSGVPSVSSIFWTVLITSVFGLVASQIFFLKDERVN